MANNVSQNGFLGLLGDVIDVTSPLVGRSIIDGLRSQFSISNQVRQGDYYMDRSSDLLRRHLQVIEVRQQDAIREGIEELV